MEMNARRLGTVRIALLQFNGRPLATRYWMRRARLIVKPVSDVFLAPVERTGLVFSLRNEIELARLKLEKVRPGAVRRNCHCSPRYLSFDVVKPPAIVFPMINLEMNGSRGTIVKEQSRVVKKSTSAGL